MTRTATRSRPPTWSGRPLGRLAFAVFKNLFSFLFQRSSAEERVAQYALREHARGRALNEILADHYVVNRLETPEQRARLLDRPEIVHAFGSDVVSELQLSADS